MRRLLIVFCLLIFSASGRLVIAQQGSQWIEFSPSDESFHISMPHEPKAEPVTATYDQVNVTGVWYTAGSDSASYAIWSLVEGKPEIGWGEDSYLDVAADLFWQTLLKQARDTVLTNVNRRAGIAYVKELPTNPLPGREYAVTLGKLSGTAQIFVAQRRIFILLAADTADGPWERERFLGSFKVSPQVERMQMYGDPKGLAVADDGPIFTTKEVDQRARVLEKPEPSYTESARTFGVRGTVVLRAVFSKTGEVTRVEIVKRLPHGMTERCLIAARAIKFSPAMKDGKPVSTFMRLEHNFNLY